MVFCGRREEWGEQTARLAREAGGEATFVRADVRIEAEVQALVDRTASEYGRIDCAFNNAGFEAMAPLVEQTETNSDLSLDTNVKGVFFSLKHEIRLMKEAGGGAIVNESSIAGLRGIPDNSLYSASKHAVIGLTKTAALEKAGFVRVFTREGLTPYKSRRRDIAKNVCVRRALAARSARPCPKHLPRPSPFCHDRSRSRP